MTEKDFLEQIDPLPLHDFYYFAKADWSLGFDATCRAYITLKNSEDVFLFRDRFDGYVFVDAKGAEYPAIVEYAPFQGLPKNKSRRHNNKVNTIEEEPHYQQFLTKLAESRETKVNECKLDFNLNTKKEEITSTPLLEYLAQKKKERRREDGKKRIDDKRRQREDDKDKRKINTKIIQVKSSTSIGSKSSKEQVVTDQISAEDLKNARMQRRAERSQRRREAFVMRKVNERREKALKETSSETNIEEVTNTSEIKTDVINADKRERKNSRPARRDREKLKEKKAADHFDEKQTEKNDNLSIETLNLNDEHSLQRQRSAEERRIRNKDRPSIAIYQPKARLRKSEESDVGGVLPKSGSNSDCEQIVKQEKPKIVEELSSTRTKKVSRYSEKRNERRNRDKFKEGDSQNFVKKDIY